MNIEPEKSVGLVGGGRDTGRDPFLVWVPTGIPAPTASPGTSPGALPSAYSECDVERHGSPLEKDGQAVTVLDVLHETVVVRLAAHLLAVDLANHVAPLDAGLGGRATLIHARHDDALADLEV